MADVAEIPDADAYLIDTHGFGLDEWCGVFALPHEEGVAVVETGPSTTFETVLEGLDAIGYGPEDVTHVLPTHIHLDHGGATWRFLEACPDATAYVHEVGAPYFVEPAKVDKLLESVERAIGEDRFPMYGTFEPLDPDRVVEVAGGDQISVGGRQLELLDAPGHAPHQYNVYDPAASMLYVGDAAGIKTPNSPMLMTTPPPAFDPDAWWGTIDMLDMVEADRLALTHFGWVDKQPHLDRFRDDLAAWIHTIEDHREQGLSFQETVQAILKVNDDGLSIYDQATWREEVRMNTRGVWLWLDRRG